MKNAGFEIFESPILRERYYRYIHKSGLPIYVFPKKLSSTYAIFGTRYGSIDNRFGVEGEHSVMSVPDGIAHFLEHKLFANEDGSDAFEHFSALGADANAYTSFNKTAYLFSCTENLEESLSELLDFVTHPYFTEESVRREQGIIAQEIKMYDDSPAEACYYGMLENLYRRHSIRRNICGTVDSIAKITPELLYECYRVFYNAENMALVVCGDVQPEIVLRIADKHLPDKRKDIRVIRESENELETPEVYRSRSAKRMNVAKPIFNIGIKDVDIPKHPVDRLRRDAAMSILNEMLFARSGELYSELFESGMISPEMSYCYTISESFAFNSLAGEADDPDAVLKKIKSYIRTAKLSEEDFEMGKRVMYAEFVKEFDSTESIANNLLSFVFDGSDMLEYADIISGVSFEDVKRLALTAFRDEYFTISVIHPLNSKETNTEDK